MKAEMPAHIGLGVFHGEEEDSPPDKLAEYTNIHGLQSFPLNAEIALRPRQEALTIQDGDAAEE